MLPLSMTTTVSDMARAFFLIVGYIDKGNLQRLLDAFKLILHIFPEPHIKGAKGSSRSRTLG